MAFSKWFWDVFPKRMMALWWVFMVALVVITMFWRNDAFLWAEAHLVLVAWTIVGLLLLVGVGNYIPGVPNMPLPLLIGWLLAAGFPVGIAIVSILMTWIIAWYGTTLVYIRARHEGENLVRRWKLNQSERYKAAVTAVRTVLYVVRKSRVGKFAAYCGHVNIAAGVNGYNVEAFYRESCVGHLLWTLQYVALGFLMSWLLPYVGKLFN